MKKLLFGMLLLFLISIASGCPPEVDENYRTAMRSLVQEISAYAKAAHPGFLIVPQNGEALLTDSGEASGNLATSYLEAIDGLGREDLNYGYEADNQATPLADRTYILDFLRRAQTAKVQVLVTDYCTTPALVDQAFAANSAEGFISFPANQRDLNAIPPYPAQPFQSNADDITMLAEAKNFLYLINTSAFAHRDDFLDALADTNYDLLILDLFDEENEALDSAALARLRYKANGGRRLVLAYLSIGEAEDYRYYWQSAWRAGSPAWLDSENPNWPGNYAVRYWESDWKAILFGASSAYLDRILDAGFDGVYLDKIDAYEFFEE